MTPPDRCVRSVRRRKTRYRRVGRYPGATHAFDLGRDGVLQGMVGNPGFYGGSLAKYDVQATADAERRIRAFLARYPLRAP